MEKDYQNGGGITKIKPALIIDMAKVRKEWDEETKGMTDLEKLKLVIKKLNDNQNK
jgi:hypothetical protein